MRSITVEFWIVNPSHMKTSNSYGIFKLRMYTESKAFRGNFAAKNLFFKMFLIIGQNISKINGFRFLR